MRHRVKIRGDEFAARVLVDAQLRILYLVVVDEPVEAHNHRPDIVVVRQRIPARVTCASSLATYLTT